MELKGEGIDPAKQSGEGLVGTARLELFVAAGAAAIERAVQTDTAKETSLDPVDIKETIIDLLTPAYRGFQITLERINNSRKKKEQLAVVGQETVTAEFEEWFDEDRLAYIIKAMETDPRLTWTLLATPNVTITADEYLAGTRTFGESQPLRTDIWSNIVKLYTPEEISGTDPSNGKSVKFKLVPNKFTPELYGDVATQKQKLAELQAEAPFLEATSPLEDLTRLDTLRASGNELLGSGTHDATYMRNFMLEPKRLEGNLCVPRSYVDDSGWLCVYRSRVQNIYASRASVG